MQGFSILNQYSVQIIRLVTIFFSNNAQACDMPNGTINATFNANCADIYNKSKVASDGKIIIFDLASNQGEELMYK